MIFLIWAYTSPDFEQTQKNVVWSHNCTTVTFVSSDLIMQNFTKHKPIFTSLYNYEEMIYLTSTIAAVAVRNDNQGNSLWWNTSITGNHRGTNIGCCRNINKWGIYICFSYLVILSGSSISYKKVIKVVSLEVYTYIYFILYICFCKFVGNIFNLFIFCSVKIS